MVLVLLSTYSSVFLLKKVFGQANQLLYTFKGFSLLKNYDCPKSPLVKGLTFYLLDQIF